MLSSYHPTEIYAARSSRGVPNNDVSAGSIFLIDHRFNLLTKDIENFDRYA